MLIEDIDERWCITKESASLPIEGSHAQDSHQDGEEHEAQAAKQLHGNIEAIGVLHKHGAEHLQNAICITAYLRACMHMYA